MSEPQAGMSEHQQGQARSQLARHLNLHMEQLQHDLHRPCPESLSLTAHQLMQAALEQEILEIKYLLRDIPYIQFNTPAA